MLAEMKPFAMTVVLFTVSLILALPALSQDSRNALTMSLVPAGSQAIPFELASLDGTRVRSSDLAGKVVLINFWATWCGPCKEEMPSLARLQRQMDPEAFVLLTVTTDVHRQGIAQFLSYAGVALPVLFDEDQEVSRSFMVRGLPTTVLMGRDGSLLGRVVGPRAWDSPEAVALVRQILERGK
ncbi:MAG: TlpA disulfide reductase family protein [Nitrospira sp.]